jgi:pyruvate/2-oxoglutarate dehydrogenase complex dihydrolipoamide dehydrogenase (E3) component
MAQAFRRLGSAVTVLEGANALSREDPELAGEVLAGLRAEGVEIREGVTISHIEPSAGGFHVHFEGEGQAPLAGSHLLVAAGRRPNVEGLGLEAAGIGFTRTGITVRSDLRTTNAKVYAVGDVAGGAQFTHAASYHASLVLRSALFRLSARLRPTAIPRVTYTDPELAVAGLTEAAAIADGHAVNVLRWPFAENDRAQANGQTRGHIKVVTGRKGQILGAGIVGPHAGELIGFWQLAVDQGLKIQDIAQTVLPYPTLSEVSRRAAVLSYGPSLRSPWLKRALRLMRILG